MINGIIDNWQANLAKWHIEMNDIKMSKAERLLIEGQYIAASLIIPDLQAIKAKIDESIHKACTIIKDTHPYAPKNYAISDNLEGYICGIAEMRKELKELLGEENENI